MEISTGSICLSATLSPTFSDNAYPRHENVLSSPLSTKSMAKGWLTSATMNNP